MTTTHYCWNCGAPLGQGGQLRTLTIEREVQQESIADQAEPEACLLAVGEKGRE